MSRLAACAVRVAEDRDLIDVLCLIDDTRGRRTCEVTETERSTWSRALETPNLSIYVAEVGSEVVGTTSLLVMPHVTYGCRPTAFIEPMVVAQAHRRRGVGRALMERVLVDAREAGVRKVQLLSHKRHAGDGAHDFYRGLGFAAEAEGFRLYL